LNSGNSESTPILFLVFTLIVADIAKMPIEKGIEGLTKSVACYFLVSLCLAHGICTSFALFVTRFLRLVFTEINLLCHLQKTGNIPRNLSGTAVVEGRRRFLASYPKSPKAVLFESLPKVAQQRIIAEKP
jgi:hypothetical protein